MATKKQNSKKGNIAKRESKVNPKTLSKALRALKSRFATEDVKKMSEIPDEYVTGTQFALGLGYDTMIKRFYDPKFLTIEDLLNVSDITGTDVEIIAKLALKEAKETHEKRDITQLLIDDH